MSMQVGKTRLQVMFSSVSNRLRRVLRKLASSSTIHVVMGVIVSLRFCRCC